MKRYIRASNSFSSKEDICKAVEFVFDGYVARKEFLEGSKRYSYSLAENTPFADVCILVGVTDTSSRVPRALYSGSSGDRYPCVIKISDKEDTYPLLEECKKQGFGEATNYNNSQWGTYKVIISSYSDLTKFYKIFERYIMNDLEGQLS
jgi:hypothetical protein